MSNNMIGICITTKNRKDVFEICLEAHLKFKPENSRIFIIDDGSDERYANSNIRNEVSKGISHVKNQSLQLMYEAGCDSLFAWDDDAFPLCKDWHLPYINSGEHHLSTTFYKPCKVDSYEYLNIFRSPNGYCQYFTRHCIDIVGGYDTRFNNKFEHCDLSRRIYNAGLTKYMYQDVINSKELIYSLDEHNEIKRSFTKKEMDANLKSGIDLFNSKALDKTYIEFRT